MWGYLAAVLLCSTALRSSLAYDCIPCSDMERTLRHLCRCRSENNSVSNSVIPCKEEGVLTPLSVDCDGVVFAGGFPPLPLGAPVVSFSQRRAGHQALPMQYFADLSFPVRRLDFSGNSIRKLTERLVTGLQSTLTDLILADNLLGDYLNPIFSTKEFHGLRHLSILDLSGNSIRSIEEGILKGCDNLMEFRLDRNKLVSIPSASLSGPDALRKLSLKENRITKISEGAFLLQRSLEYLDLQGNEVSVVERSAFAGLHRLRSLGLGRNRLTKLNVDFFEGAERTESVDLSENFLSNFPSVALKGLVALKHLNLSANMLTHVHNGHLGSMVSLETLDLSRNAIASLQPGTFLGVHQLRYLDISVNALGKKVENNAFEGLDNLETLVLRDTGVLSIPASALGRLPRLSTIHLDSNRVTVVLGDFLRSTAERVSSLFLAGNMISELPAAAFRHFKRLTRLDLGGNLLHALNAEIFLGLEGSLEYLSASHNRISRLVGPPLQLSELRHLDISGNRLSELSSDAFTAIPNVTFLNISRNPHLNLIPSTLFHLTPELVTVDLSHNGLKSLPADLFAETHNLESIHLSDNSLQGIPKGAFRNMRKLTFVDLSNNRIVGMKRGAFANVNSIRHLSLRGNLLDTFKEECFSTETGLETLDLSDNQLTYLFPSSFSIHPRLKTIIAHNNKFSFFPVELMATLQLLEHVDLSHNTIKSIGELDSARLPRLRTLLLSHNEIESIGEMAFHNSSQLQILDLGYNNLNALGERTFEGLVRLESLNLEHNLLTELPIGLFDRSRLQRLESINLAHNLFEVPPLKALQKQYFSLSSVDLSHNKLVDIPAGSSILVNIKELDLSFNPLSGESVRNILAEPKAVRKLNLAATGVAEVPRLESPFLHHLNLSHNNIAILNEAVFVRTPLLEFLDVSHNRMANASTWLSLKRIQYLDLSNNPIASIRQGDLDGLKSLKLLNIENLEQCTEMETDAFKPLVNLAELRAYNFPRLGRLDVRGILQSLPALRMFDVEIKDNAVGGDQLQPALHPRLRDLGVRGRRLKSVSSEALAGLRSRSIAVRLRDTSIATLPPDVLFSLPRSSSVVLDVTGSKLTTLQPQLLVALDDRKADTSVLGLETNPIRCDCAARALRLWLPTSRVPDIKCSTPDYLFGQLLVDIVHDELTCAPRISTTVTAPPSTEPSTTATEPAPTVEEQPEPTITWRAPINAQLSFNKSVLITLGIVAGFAVFLSVSVIIIYAYRFGMCARLPSFHCSSMLGIDSF